MTHICANPIAVIMTFPHLQMAFTFLLIINKTLLHNGNCPITDPITNIEAECNLDLVTHLVSAKTVTKSHNVTKSNVVN